MHVTSGAEALDINTSPPDSVLGGNLIYDLLGLKIGINDPSNISCSNDTAALTNDGLAIRVEPDGDSTPSLPLFRTSVPFHRLPSLCLVPRSDLSYIATIPQCLNEQHPKT